MKTTLRTDITVEEVEVSLHKRFGFSVERQKEFQKLYSLCLKKDSLI